MTKQTVPGFPEPPIERFWDLSLNQCVNARCQHEGIMRACQQRDEDIDTSFYEESIQWFDRRIAYLKTLKLLETNL